MESNLQITVKGIPEALAHSVGDTIFEIIQTLDQTLDFRRMHRIIITADFAGELAKLSSATVSGNPITHTNEEYAIAVAQVLTFPHSDDFEILPVISAQVATGLAVENNENCNEEVLRTALHLLHHEFCHVHDDNKKIDAFSSLMFKHNYTGKDRFIRPLAEICWSEYIANLLSSATAKKSNMVSLLGKSFGDAIERTKPDIDKEILSYRYHGDLDRLLYYFERHGAFLIKTAAYMIGYMDGLGSSLANLSPEAAERLTGSYFEPTWNAMQKALRGMHRLYPIKWDSLGIYDSLAAVMESYYAAMGFILSTTENEQAYISIPFRSETTPPEI
jgi:hypothetical protein